MFSDNLKEIASKSDFEKGQNLTGNVCAIPEDKFGMEIKIVETYDN